MKNAVSIYSTSPAVKVNCRIKAVGRFKKDVQYISPEGIVFVGVSDDEVINRTQLMESFKLPTRLTEPKRHSSEEPEIIELNYE